MTSASASAKAKATILPPELWTLGRYAYEHGISRNSASARAKHPLFPKPIAYYLGAPRVLASGQVIEQKHGLYLERDLRAFDDVWEPHIPHAAYRGE